MNTPSEQELTRVLGYLNVDPRNADLLARAFDLCLALGRLDEARKIGDAAVAAYPENPFFQHRYASLLIADGKFDQAESTLVALYAKFNDPSIAYNLAYVYFRQGRYDESYETLQRHAENEQFPSQAVVLCMRVLHHLGQIKQALEFAGRHLDAQSQNAEFLAVAALLYLDDEQIELAERFGNAALSGGARPIEAFVVIGTIELGRGQVQAARERFASALELNPSEGRGWLGLGLASLLNQEIETAEQLLERAAGHLPTHIGTLHALGWCRIMRRDIAGAEAAFQKSLSLDRNFGESHGGMAVVAALKGDRKFAEESIERAIRLDPRGLSAHYARAVLSDEVKDPEKFRQLAMRVLSSRQTPFGTSFADMLKSRS